MLRRINLKLCVMFVSIFAVCIGFVAYASSYTRYDYGNYGRLYGTRSVLENSIYGTAGIVNTSSTTRYTCLSINSKSSGVLSSLCGNLGAGVESSIWEIDITDESYTYAVSNMYNSGAPQSGIVESLSVLIDMN